MAITISPIYLLSYLGLDLKSHVPGKLAWLCLLLWPWPWRLVTLALKMLALNACLVCVAGC